MNQNEERKPHFSLRSILFTIGFVLLITGIFIRYDVSLGSILIVSGMILICFIAFSSRRYRWGNYWKDRQNMSGWCCGFNPFPGANSENDNKKERPHGKSY